MESPLAADKRMDLYIRPIQVARVLLVIIGILLLANCTVIGIRHVTGHDVMLGLIPLFDFNAERNVPTLYSSVALLMTALLLAFIGYRTKSNVFGFNYWYGLACIFLFLTIDETSEIHEGFTGPLRNTLDTSGILFYAWVIPYAAFLVVFLAVYMKFLLGLERRFQYLFCGSGAIFVTGAIGFELLGGLQHDLHGNHNLVYYLLYTTEELLEMLGIALFIYSLLSYIEAKFGTVAVNLRS